ncbi:MAG: zinc ribbon domain-containing protein [Candidatus Bathyarchaeota archaeon]|nr:zinc ribbon domain-containing protein [Candidatus Bathyarchaeota archaeon]
MSEVKKCPKCGGEMKRGKGLVGYGSPIRFVKIGDLRGDTAFAFYCKNCGFIELYKKMKEKTE